MTSELELEVHVNVKPPPHTPVQVTFTDVCYSVSQGKNKPPKQLLKGVSGFAQSGKILAIMGPSGFYLSYFSD